MGRQLGSGVGVGIEGTTVGKGANVGGKVGMGMSGMAGVMVVPEGSAGEGVGVKLDPGCDGAVGRGVDDDSRGDADGCAGVGVDDAVS